MINWKRVKEMNETSEHKVSIYFFFLYLSIILSIDLNIYFYYD